MEQTQPSRKIPYNLLLYIGISFGAFFPCLVLGKTYHANDLLHFFGPMRAYLRDQLLQGSFPLWNPYIFCGQPYLADLQTMMFYPPNYLTLFFPVAYGFSVFFFFHMALAAFGMHFWLRSLKLSKVSCAIGALTYALSAFFWWELIHPPVLAAFACLPWFFATVENLAKQPRAKSALGAGLAFAFLFLAGSLQVTLGGVYGGFFYFLARIKPQAFGANSWKENFSSPVCRKKMAALLFLAGWAALPLLAQLVPTLEFSKLSVRRTPDLTYEDFNGAFSMQPQTFYQFLFPTISIPPNEDMETAIQTVRGTSDVDFLASFGYLGIWLPALVFLAFRRKEKGLVLWLGAGAFLCVLLAFGKYFFIHKLFCAVVPGFSLIRAPFRFIYFYVLTASVLLAWGYQELERAVLQKDKHPYLFTGLMVYGFILGIVSLARIDQTWRETFALTLGVVGLALWMQTKSWQKLGAILFQTALVAPLLFFGWQAWTLGSPQIFDFKSNSILSQLKLPTEGRLLVSNIPYFLKIGAEPTETFFPANSLMPMGVRTNTGYNPLHLKKTDDLLKISLGITHSWMGLEEIVTGKTDEEVPGFTRETLPEGYNIFHCQGPSGYLSTPAQIQVMTTDMEQLDALKRPDFQGDRTALLYKEPPVGVPLPAGQPVSLRYERILDRPDRQSFKVQLAAPSLVVFSEVFYPGWKAWVDGSPSEIFNANYIFRGLFIPAGSHQVEFKYQPVWWPAIPMGLMIWLLSLPLLWLFFKREASVTRSENTEAPAR